MHEQKRIKTMRHSLLKVLILAGTVCLGAARADLINFSLTGQWAPNQSALIEKPGQTTGWGFTVTNDSTDQWAAITNSYYCAAGVDCAQPSTSSLGTYYDFAGPNFVLIAPNTTYHENYTAGAFVGGNYVAGSGTGVGAFTMYPWVPQFQSLYENGSITLTYDMFTGDDLGTQVGGDQSTSTFARVVVPEYSSLLILLGMFGALAPPLAWRTLRRRKAA